MAPLRERFVSTRRRKRMPAAIRARAERGREENVDDERRRLALRLDAELRSACGGESVTRAVIGTIAAALLRRHGHQRLGFARVGDYAKERLGISGRELESLAFVANRLAEL